VWRRALRAALVLQLCGWLGASSFHGQPIELAADVRTVPNPPQEFFWYRSIVQLGDAVLFMAEDGVHGLELWRSDGTAAGTWMVKDICPGSCGSRPYWPQPESVNGAGGLLFFAAQEGVHGEEPWVTDGTPEGTRLLVDLRPGIAGSRPVWFRWSGDEMLFVADDGVHGRELWSAGADGTTVSLVADIRPGPEGSDPNALVGGGGRTFFAANDGVHGAEPWITDGSGAGTTRLADLVPGPGSSMFAGQSFPLNPGYVAFLDGRWFFQVGSTSDFSGTELWATDGTPGGTIRIVDGDGVAVSPEWEVVAAGEVVYFSARNVSDAELWRTDGTPQGTFRVATPTPPWTSLFGLTPLGDRLFFRAEAEGLGREPWITDGSAPGTELLKDIHPGAGASIVFARRDAVVGDRVFFLADDGVHGQEPWVSDGTTAGTVMVEDIVPGPAGSGPGFIALSSFAGAGTSVLFFAFGPGVTFLEPWVTTPEGNGASLLADLDQQGSSFGKGVIDLAPEMAGVGGLAFWPTVDDQEERGLGRTGGDPGAAEILVEQPAAADAFALFLLRSFPEPGIVTFVDHLLAGSDSSSRLWRTDGTTGGTYPLTTYHSAGRLFATSSRLVFENAGLFVTDGTSIWPLSPLGNADQVGSFGDALVLLASGSGSDGLWLAQPPFETATLLEQHEPDPGFLAAEIVEAGGRVFYAPYDAAHGRELWVSDGTPGGAALVLDLAPGAASSIDPEQARSPGFGHAFSPQPTIVPLGDDVVFVADDGIHGRELWRSDGTSAGTTLVADLRPGPVGSEPLWLVTAGDLVYFVAHDGVHGRELWRTDGTGAGTVLIDLIPGLESSAPAWLLGVDGVLYFVFTSPAHGVELWRLAPGATAPELVQDLNPGPASSSPSALTVSGRRLFFAANDGVAGYEPHSLVLPTRLPIATLTHRFVGGDIELKLGLEDPSGFGLSDNAGPEVVLELPSELAPVLVEATHGAATFVGQSVHWNGVIAPGESLEIVVLVSPPAAPEVASWSLQGEVFFDTTADSVHDSTVLTDDPAAPGDADPTVILAPHPSHLFADDFEWGDLSSWSWSAPPP
jgi:ELWxxDGT repeat protein